MMKLRRQRGKGLADIKTDDVPQIENVQSSRYTQVKGCWHGEGRREYKEVYFRQGLHILQVLYLRTSIIQPLTELIICDKNQIALQTSLNITMASSVENLADANTDVSAGVDNPGYGVVDMETKSMQDHDQSSHSQLLHLPGSPNSPNTSIPMEIELKDPKHCDLESGNPPARRSLWAYHQENDTRQKAARLWQNHRLTIIVAIVDVIVILYSIVGIMRVGFEKAIGIFLIGIFVWFCLTYMVIRDNCGEELYDWLVKPIYEAVNKNWGTLKWVVYGVLLICIGIFLAVDTRKKPIRFLSLLGLFIYVSIAYLLSKHRKKIIWRPVIWGLALQFIFGLLILRTWVGYKFFKILGDQVNVFLDYSDAGSAFVFGESFKTHYFAFKVLPIVIFFSSAISLLYYLQVMPLVMKKIAWLMQVTMKTSVSESLSAAGNIFVGQTEAPLLVRPFIKNMTMSELHAVMTGGFATIAGGVLAAFISFGIPASHLLSASVMSAPAALAISKLMYPETEESETKNADDIDIPPMEEVNVIQAAANGASNAITLVANIAANLIAFLAFLAFIDAILSYLGSMVDHPELSFNFICSGLLRPFAFIIGVDWEDSGVVAELLGTKTFANEFIAFLDLKKIIENENTGNGRTISERSKILATYALCGFSNFSSIGIQLGGLGPMAPSRKPDLAVVAFRALIAGTIACFMTACVAGILL